MWEFGFGEFDENSLGKIVETSHHLLTHLESQTPKNEVLESFVSQYYGKTVSLPKVILTNIKLKNKQEIQHMLESNTNAIIKISNPKVGNKQKLVSLCQKNANLIAQTQEKYLPKIPKLEQLLERVKEDLQLEILPKE